MLTLGCAQGGIIFQAQGQAPKPFHVEPRCDSRKLWPASFAVPIANADYETFRKAMDTLNYDGPLQMYKNPQVVNFKDLERKKTAVFLTINDTDRSVDTLASRFYTQAIQDLCESANTDRLPVPARFILDDFATNVVIPDFDKIISVIRSQEIYVSIILQSLS